MTLKQNVSARGKGPHTRQCILHGKKPSILQSFIPQTACIMQAAHRHYYDHINDPIIEHLLVCQLVGATFTLDDGQAIAHSCECLCLIIGYRQYRVQPFDFNHLLCIVAPNVSYALSYSCRWEKGNGEVGIVCILVNQLWHATSLLPDLGAVRRRHILECFLPF